MNIFYTLYKADRLSLEEGCKAENILRIVATFLLCNCLSHLGRYNEKHVCVVYTDTLHTRIRQAHDQMVYSVDTSLIMVGSIITVLNRT
jgi:hypothetical protein